jgi:cytochrome c-type biogenesis protein CcmH/NrfF
MRRTSRNTDRLSEAPKGLHTQTWIFTVAVGLSLTPMANLTAQSVDGAFDGVEAAAPDGDEVREAELDDLTAQIGAALRCPICRQQSVAESSSRIAREMQGVIRGMLIDGKTPEEIEAYFVESYGEWILLRPKMRGLTGVVYVLPALAFALALVLVGAKIRSWRGTRTDERSAAYAAQTEATLDARDRKWLAEAIREGRS